MEANKTLLKEILKKHTKEEWRTLPSGGRELVVITNYDGAFEEYANKLILEKDKEIERLEQEKIMLERYCSKYESELSELKEKANLYDKLCKKVND